MWHNFVNKMKVIILNLSPLSSWMNNWVVDESLLCVFATFCPKSLTDKLKGHKHALALSQLHVINRNTTGFVVSMRSIVMQAYSFCFKVPNENQKCMTFQISEQLIANS